MQVLRHASRTRRNARLYRLALLAALLLLLLLFLLVPRAPLAALAAALLLLLLRAMLNPRDASWVVGARGEQHALDALKVLPNDYTAVTNYIVPGSRAGDVDLLVLGPMGVVVVEVKAYSGTILHENGSWWRVQSGGRKSPLRNVSAQARANLRAVTGFLARERAALPALAEVYIPATALLVFVGTDRLNMVALDMPALPVGEFAAHIRRLPARLTPAQAAALPRLFAPPSRR